MMQPVFQLESNTFYGRFGRRFFWRRSDQNVLTFSTFFTDVRGPFEVKGNLGYSVLLLNAVPVLFLLSARVMTLSQNVTGS